jgi:hypothetical protein
MGKVNLIISVEDDNNGVSIKMKEDVEDCSFYPETIVFIETLKPTLESAITAVSTEVATKVSEMTGVKARVIKHGRMP